MKNNYLSILNNINNSLLILVAFIIPSGFYYKSGILISLLFILWLFSGSWRKLKSLELVNYLLPIFFFIYLINYLFFTHNGFQIKEFEKFFVWLAIPIIVSAIPINDRIYQKITVAFIFSSIFFILIALIYGFFDMYRTGQNEILVSETIYTKISSYGLLRIYHNAHPTFSSLFLVFSGYLIYTHNKWNKLLKTALLVGIGALILLLNSMMGFIAFFLLISFFIYKYNKWSLPFIIGIALFIYSYNPLNLKKLEHFKKTELKATDKDDVRNVLTLRMVNWNAALEVIKEHIWFGVGVTNVKNKMIEKYRLNKNDYSVLHKLGPHNQYLHFLVSIGFLGFLFFLFLILFPFTILVNKELYFIFISTLMLYFTTDDILVRQQGLVFFVFFYSIITNRKSD